MPIAGAESVRVADGPRVRATDGYVCGWSVADAWAWCRHAQNGAKGAHRGVRRHGARLGGARGGVRWGRGLGGAVRATVPWCVCFLDSVCFWTVFAQQRCLLSNRLHSNRLLQR